jgi:hypothetical protein
MAGKIIADQIEHSTAGSLDTQYVVQGSAKAWMYWEQISTHEAYDSFNIASITDAGTGRSYPIAFTNSMSDGNYSGSFLQNGSSSVGYLYFSNNYAGSFSEKTSASFGCRAYANSDVDAAELNVTVAGDLA